MRQTWNSIAVALVYVCVAALVSVVVYFSFNLPAHADPAAPTDRAGSALPVGDQGGFLGTGIYITDQAR